VKLRRPNVACGTARRLASFTRSAYGDWDWVSIPHQIGPKPPMNLGLSPQSTWAVSSPHPNGPGFKLSSK